MNKEIKVSIIVPVYNTEKYLRKCIESLINQTYTNIEIVLVDDGSTDNSLSIMKEYNNTDSRIVIITQPNSGIYLARNAGINIATGEYLMFVDADDWINEDAIEMLIKKIIKFDVDLVKYRIIFEPSEKESAIILNSDKDDVLVKEETKNKIYDLLINTNRLNNLANEIVKKELIKSTTKSERISQGEDALRNYEIFTNADRILIIPDCLYHYRTNENSTTNSLKKEKIVSNINDIFIVYKYKLQYMKKWNYTEKKYLKKTAIRLNDFLTNQLLKLYKVKDISNEEIKQIYRNIYNNETYISLSKNIDSRDINDENIYKRLFKKNLLGKKINQNISLKYFIKIYFKIKEKKKDK